MPAREEIKKANRAKALMKYLKTPNAERAFQQGADDFWNSEK